MSLTKKKNNCCGRNLTLPENSSCDKIQPENDAIDDLTVANAQILGNLRIENELFVDSIKPNSQNIISVPNMKFNVKTNYDGYRTFSPNEIKSFRFLIIDYDISLDTDASCDGTEIIIYNQANGYDLRIEHLYKQIFTLEPKTAVTLVYIHCLEQWIITSVVKNNDYLYD